MKFTPGQETVVTLYFDESTPKEFLEMLQTEWEIGGPGRLGDLLVQAVSQDLISATDIAKRRGITRQGASKAAKEEAAKGADWPKKNEKGEWVAPLSEWQRLFEKRKK